MIRTFSELGEESKRIQEQNRLAAGSFDLTEALRIGGCSTNC